MTPEISPKSRNGKVLLSFVAYCVANPSQRFWQALVNWACVGFIAVTNTPPYMLEDRDELTDTYPWEGRNGRGMWQARQQRQGGEWNRFALRHKTNVRCGQGTTQAHGNTPVQRMRNQEIRGIMVNAKET